MGPDMLQQLWAHPCEWDTMLVTADWVDDQSDSQSTVERKASLFLSVALRWASKHKRWPKVSPRGKSVSWVVETKFFVLPRKARAMNHVLPRELFIGWASTVRLKNLRAAFGWLGKRLHQIREQFG